MPPEVIAIERRKVQVVSTRAPFVNIPAVIMAYLDVKRGDILEWRLYETGQIIMTLHPKNGKIKRNNGNKD